MLASTVGERARVDRVEADLVDQLCDRSLRLRVIAGEGEADASRLSGGATVVAQARPDDRVERLDHTPAREVGLHELARARAVAVELSERAISLRVVVGGVDHDLARDAIGRQL